MISKAAGVLATAIGFNKSESQGAFCPAVQPLFTNANTTADAVSPELSTVTTSSTPVTRVAAPYNKYASLIASEPISSRDDVNLSLLELFFGREKTSFEAEKDFYLQDRQRQMTTKKRLGQGASRSLTTIDGTMWTGPIYMGSGR